MFDQSIFSGDIGAVFNQSIYSDSSDVVLIMFKKNQNVVVLHKSDQLITASFPKNQLICVVYSVKGNVTTSIRNILYTELPTY